MWYVCTIRVYDHLPSSRQVEDASLVKRMRFRRYGFRSLSWQKQMVVWRICKIFQFFTTKLFKFSFHILMEMWSGIIMLMKNFAPPRVILLEFGGYLFKLSTVHDVVYIFSGRNSRWIKPREPRQTESIPFFMKRGFRGRSCFISTWKPLAFSYIVDVAHPLLITSAIVCLSCRTV